MRISREDPNALTPNQIGFLLNSIRDSGETWEQVSRELVAGTATSWIVESDKAEGVFVTQIVSGYLFVWHFGGRNLYTIYKSILRGFQEIAKKHHLKGIRGVVENETLLKLYERNGFSRKKIVVEWRV